MINVFDKWFMAWWPRYGRPIFLILNLGSAAPNVVSFYILRNWFSLAVAIFNLGVATWLWRSILSDKCGGRGAV